MMRSQVIDSSNMTHEEFYRVNGTLTPERIDEVLDKVSSIEDAKSFAAYAQEAIGQYPAEDFMHEHVSKLHDFAKRLRGDNKKDLLHIIEGISDALQCQFYATDYGMSELRKIINQA